MKELNLRTPLALAMGVCQRARAQLLHGCILNKVKGAIFKDVMGRCQKNLRIVLNECL